MSLERCWVQRPERAIRAGFTLIEMMIVVAVIAILAVIVVPSYQSYVIKARRTDAKMALTSTAQTMERHATENAATGYSNFVLGTPSRSENGHYNLRLSNLGVASFTLSAAPQGAQASDSGCGTFTLNEKGVRGVTGPKTWQECWQ